MRVQFLLLRSYVSVGAATSRGPVSVATLSCLNDDWEAQTSLQAHSYIHSGQHNLYHTLFWTRLNTWELRMRNIYILVCSTRAAGAVCSSTSLVVLTATIFEFININKLYVQTARYSQPYPPFPGMFLYFYIDIDTLTLAHRPYWYWLFFLHRHVCTTAT